MLNLINPLFPDGPVNPCIVGDFGQNEHIPNHGMVSTEDYSIVINGTILVIYLWNTGVYKCFLYLTLYQEPTARSNRYE